MPETILTPPAQATPEAGDTTTTTATAAGAEASGTPQDPKAASAAPAAASDPKAPSTDAAGSDAKPAPAAQDVKVVAPEGYAMEAKALEEFVAKAKAAGLSSQQAQGVLDLQASTFKASQEAEVAAAKKQDEEWQAEIRKNYGADFDKTRAIAAKAIDRFGSPSLRKFLEVSGLGNHPELVSFAARVGRAIAEDRIAGTTSHPATGTDDSKAMLAARYPHSPPK